MPHAKRCPREASQSYWVRRWLDRTEARLDVIETTLAVLPVDDGAASAASELRGTHLGHISALPGTTGDHDDEIRHSAW